MADWSTACLDWESRLLAGRSLVPDLPLFRPEAERALRIFRRLRVPDIIGQPTLAEACGPWFFPIVEALFGSYDPATNRRMIQEYFQLIPKKNGKSSNGGAVMVVALIVNRRPQGEFLLIAPTKEIADIAFKQASGTILIDPELAKLFQIQRHIRLITHRKTGATLQVKAADTDVITGSKATGTMIDETHVFAKKANAADIFVELRGALTARPDGFLFQTTTQSKAPPTGQFKSELNMARRVRDGKIRLPLLPILYELPHRLAEKDGWKERKYWPLVNPNLGRSVNLEFLANEVMKAEIEGPGQLALIASQHFNVEIGLSLQSDRWAGADHWLRAADDTLSLDEILLRSDVVVVGVDGGGLDDLLGFSVMGRERDTRKWMHWGKAWVHRSVLKLRQTEAPKFLELENTGDLVIVDDLSEGRAAIADYVAHIEDAGLLADKDAVGVDPMGVGLIVDEIVSKGIDRERIVGIPQGWQLNGAIKAAEVKLSEGTLVHSSQPIMVYAVGNAKVEPKGNAITITKQAAGTAKIDPLMAFFNCIALMARNPESSGGRSIYDAPDEEAPASVDDDEIDMAVLSDPSNPLFSVMRERFNAKLARDAGDDEVF